MAEFTEKARDKIFRRRGRRALWLFEVWGCWNGEILFWVAVGGIELALFG